MEEVYIRIKELRQKLGLSQEELARKVGYTDRSSIAKIEAGKVDLTNTKIAEIAKALNTTPAHLMGWDEESTSDGYYTDPETAKVAQQIYDDPDLHALFDAAEDSKPEDLKMAADLLKRLKGTNPDG